MPNNPGFYNGRSEKISEFTTENILTDADLFTFVRNATNLNIPFSQFKLALGVTGSLESVGNAFAPPVLTGVAPNYKIRAIESNNGIVSTVSAENGINIACNFTQPSGGVELIEDLSASQYKFRPLKALDPVNVNVVGDFIEISLDESPLQITNTVVVSNITDFPEPVDGVITLEDDINYIIVQPISTANRFVCGANNHITSNNPFTPLFEYTGSDTMFSGTDVNFLTTFRLHLYLY